MKFVNREQAANKLALALSKYKNRSVVVYAIPRGGVVVGKVIAKWLNVPLRLVIPRKIGHPNQPEYAIASVTESGEIIKNESEVINVNKKWFCEEIDRQRQEAKRRYNLYTKAKQLENISSKIAIVTDDGLATGLTMYAAISSIKNQNPAKIVLAVPVAPLDTILKLNKIVDEVVVLEKPEFFLGSVGAYYDSFDQVSDEEVINLLNKEK